MKKGSETNVIKRSQINLNPQNPKSHTEEEIKLQVKNIRKNGYLGGVVWNQLTGTCVDGHRRIKALDIIHKYDGSPETDYSLKVEVVNFDHKTELNQMTFMAVGNSKADYNLVAKYVYDIDYREVGISEEDYQRIRELAAVEVPEVGMGDLDDPFIAPYEPVTELDDTDEKTSEDIVKEHEEKPKMTKEDVKKEKQHCDDVASNRQVTQDLYVFLKADTVEEKRIFCELLEEPMSNSMMVSLRKVLELIQ